MEKPNHFDIAWLKITEFSVLTSVWVQRNILTLKRLVGKCLNLTHILCFPKMSFYEKEWSSDFSVNFGVIISHIFSKNFTDISQLFQKIWRFSFSILTVFTNFLDLLTVACYKETGDVSTSRWSQKKKNE